MQISLGVREVKMERILAAPLWIQYAIKGEKINAIKALREVAGKNVDGRFIGLKQAKDIVENFMGSITEHKA